MWNCYLSDDLAILSVDLRNATPLCQEGEDLIKLQEEDSETEKKQFMSKYAPVVSGPPLFLSHPPTCSLDHHGV